MVTFARAGCRQAWIYQREQSPGTIASSHGGTSVDALQLSAQKYEPGLPSAVPFEARGMDTQPATCHTLAPFERL
jgi:hypothetical protein